MAADPAWREVLLETPRCTRVTAVTEAGVTLRGDGSHPRHRALGGARASSDGGS